MPFIAKDGTAIVLVPAGQKIIVGAFCTTAIVSFSTNPSSEPENYYENARLNNIAATYGPFSADRNVKIESGPTDYTEYTVGSGTPTLTNNNFNPAAVAITGGTASGLTTLGASAVAITGGTVSGLTALGAAGAAITGGTINATSVGATTRSTVAGTSLSVTGTDSTGTPGNVTNNSASGRAAFAAAGASVVVTNSGVALVDHVFIQPRVLDATATLFSVVTAAGSFTVTANAAATATLPFDFVVIKN